MNTSLEQLEAWLQADSEDEHLEFKAGRTSYEFEKLVRYCVALANERGGEFILGVTDKPPRRVVGTEAFRNLQRQKASLFQRLHLRIEPEELHHPNGRVVIFHVPSRPIGTPLHYKGTYWMRVGEELRGMSPDELKRIFDEAMPDFSAEVCEGTDISCLAPEAIQTLRQRWHEKSRNDRLLTLTDEQLLSDAGLLVNGRATNAALILLASGPVLRQHQLGQAEIIFEFRLNPEGTRYDARENYQEGFLLCADRIWEQINLRNEVYLVQNGLFRREVRSFDDAVVREALLNAVAHRDYRLSGSVFVRQAPRTLVVESPGGFLPGIGPQNILWEHGWRNRLMAETFERCGYVERSGQGVNLMFEHSIRDAKLPPDYSRSDEYNVRLVLSGQVQDESFVRFLEEVGLEVQQSFSTEDYLVLDYMRRDMPLPATLGERLPRLRQLGVIEKTGPGRAPYVLSRRYYEFIGRKGEYTRRRGLDRETNKELLLKHIRDNAARGSRLSELRQVLPSLTAG
ncbi:MAG: putative DNA binding domain-containing protein, partial [Armatimonadota bacterium]